MTRSKDPLCHGIGTVYYWSVKVKGKFIPVPKLHTISVYRTLGSKFLHHKWASILASSWMRWRAWRLLLGIAKIDEPDASTSVGYPWNSDLCRWKVCNRWYKCDKLGQTLRYVLASLWSSWIFILCRSIYYKFDSSRNDIYAHAWSFDIAGETTGKTNVKLSLFTC
jgi:hypothetical protein